ncbi:MAG: hypothetical protein PHR16_04340 [Methylovulum sp.]|nr:hypothetical protein [Methylovulum sp.]
MLFGLGVRKMGSPTSRMRKYQTSLIRFLALSFPLLLAGCVSVDYQAKLAELSDQQRAAAYMQFELSRYDAALAWVRHALHTAQRLPATSVQVVEAYDDAGLFFYSKKDYAQSARHQAIAVLLATDNPALEAMLPIYLERLRWAWEKFRPDGDFSDIKANPLSLLDDEELVLVKDPRIREHFYQ